MHKEGEFSYVAVLGVIHDRALQESYELLTFLTGHKVDLSNFSQARKECLADLESKFPELATIHVIEAFRELNQIQMGDTLCDEMVVKEWLLRHQNILLVYGKKLLIKKITHSENSGNRRARNLMYLRDFVTKKLNW
ncbi:MAG: hypothetical protein H6779_04400 [Candidatus Nomurabacteria bacterium]|nr:MAG: hypothetical protein H6779_04400 [Candidatus Nomurabacteria bacterium]